MINRIKVKMADKIGNRQLFHNRGWFMTQQVQSNWDWGFFLDPAPFGDTTYLGWLWAGVQITLALAIFSGIIAFFFGSLFGILRTLPNRFLSFLGASYVAIFRNVPLLVQFVVWIEVIPELLPEAIRNWCYDSPMISSFIFGCICLGLFTGARICEQVRTAIQAIPSGQGGAGLALGLTLPQTYRFVLLPRAYRIVIPPMTSEILNMIKNSAVASIVGIHELSSQASIIQQNSERSYESFIAVTLAYVTINIVVMQIMRTIEKRTRLPGMRGA